MPIKIVNDESAIIGQVMTVNECAGGLVDGLWDSPYNREPISMKIQAIKAFKHRNEEIVKALEKLADDGGQVSIKHIKLLLQE